MQSSGNDRWYSSASTSSQGQDATAKQAAAPRPRIRAPTVSWWGVIRVRLGVNFTSLEASGSTSRTVHQASRALYVRCRTSSSVKFAMEILSEWERFRCYRLPGAGPRIVSDSWRPLDAMTEGGNSFYRGVPALCRFARPRCAPAATALITPVAGPDVR